MHYWHICKLSCKVLGTYLKTGENRSYKTNRQNSTKLKMAELNHARAQTLDLGLAYCLMCWSPSGPVVLPECFALYCSPFYDEVVKSVRLRRIFLFLASLSCSISYKERLKRNDKQLEYKWHCCCCCFLVSHILPDVNCNILRASGKM